MAQATVRIRAAWLIELLSAPEMFEHTCDEDPIPGMSAVTGAAMEEGGEHLLLTITNPVIDADGTVLTPKFEPQE